MSDVGYLNMKGDFMIRALEIIEELACDTGDFIEAFLKSSKSDYRALKNFSHRTPSSNRLSKEEIKNHRYYAILSKLKADGLITKNVGKGSAWHITNNGLEKLEALRNQVKIGFPNNHYLKEKSDTLVIIGFDIPEKEKRKRNWLRSILINLGFRMLQKSVWIGKIKVPSELLEDIKLLNLLDFVEIFSVGNSGTIRHIT